jgi:hypothetical protein
MCLATNALSRETPTLVSQADVLEAIDIFAKSPVSEQGKAAAAIIAKFAEESDDVTILISQNVVTWLENDNPPKFSETLLTAYLAGNVKSQLERRTMANDSYAGIQQVLKTYAQLKEIDKTLYIPEVQKLVDLEAKKELEKYVDEALKKNEK